MIYKIAANEWYKRVNNLSELEKEALAQRIDHWLHTKAPILLPRADDPSARMMNVEQVCGDWTTDVQDAFNEGVSLMTPFAGTTDTWLPTMIYTKAAKRAIHKIVDVLTTQLPTLGVLPQSKPTLQPHNRSTKVSTKLSTKDTKDTEKPQNRTTAQPQNGKQGNHLSPIGGEIKREGSNVGKQGNLSSPLVGGGRGEGLQPISTEGAVPRPAHIDQYVHLLPEDTQKRAAGYGQLMKDLGTARSNMRILMDDPKSTATEREKWAKTAVALDKRIGDLRTELDTEWDKVVQTGRVALDDFGIAHILDKDGKVADPKPKMEVNVADKNETLPKAPKKKRAPRKEYTEEEKAARIKYLQKWLRDPRPENTAEHRQQWKDNARELLSLGGTISDSMRKAAEHYKVRVPKA